MKIDTLISGLLQVSRTGYMQISPTVINMNQLIEEIIEAFQFSVTKNNVRIIVEELPDCESDPIHINQIFSNLIDNAIKYSKRDADNEITVGGYIEMESIVYFVKDNGIGIDKKNYKKVFEIFRQINPENNNGMGLGMTIVSKLLKHIDGEIWLESELAKGSTFFVKIPKKLKIH